MFQKSSDALPRLQALLMAMAAKSLCLNIGLEALFQCYNLLRLAQARTRPLSLATQAMVTAAKTIDHRVSGSIELLILFSTTSRGSQLPRYVHSSHGVRNIRSTLCTLGWASWVLPSGSYGHDIHLCPFRGHFRDLDPKARDISPGNHERISASRPHCLFRL